MSKYDEDFYVWTQAQAAALRAGTWGDLDLVNLAEEIESLGKRDRRAVESYLEVVIKHFLKWQAQPQERARRGRSWRTSVHNARRAMERIVEDSPSLQDLPAPRLPVIYRWARADAAQETDLPLASFPADCPWTVPLLQDEDYWPGEAQP
jgi:hypothetical protein